MLGAACSRPSSQISSENPKACISLLEKVILLSLAPVNANLQSCLKEERSSSGSSSSVSKLASF